MNDLEAARAEFDRDKQHLISDQVRRTELSVTFMDDGCVRLWLGRRDAILSRAQAEELCKALRTALYRDSPQETPT